MSIIFALCLAILAGASGASVAVTNPSFELSSGWTNLQTASSELFAPIDGQNYAMCTAGDAATAQDLGVVAEANSVYTLSVWARSVDPTYPGLLPEGLRSGTHRKVIANVDLSAGETSVASKAVVVSAPQLKGVAAKDGPNAANDDGANVYLESGYRMQMSSRIFYQQARVGRPQE